MIFCAQVLTPHMETVLGGRGAGYRFRRFEELCVDLFRKTLVPVERVTPRTRRSHAV